MGKALVALFPPSAGGLGYGLFITLPLLVEAVEYSDRAPEPRTLILKEIQ
jgi:hypothetical protein